MSLTLATSTALIDDQVDWRKWRHRRQSRASVGVPNPRLGLEKVAEEAEVLPGEDMGLLLPIGKLKDQVSELPLSLPWGD